MVSSHVDSSRAQVKSSQVKPSQAKSSQVKPCGLQLSPSQVKSSQIKSSQVKPSQAKSRGPVEPTVESSGIPSSQVEPSPVQRNQDNPWPEPQPHPQSPNAHPLRLEPRPCELTPPRPSLSLAPPAVWELALWAARPLGWPSADQARLAARHPSVPRLTSWSQLRAHRCSKGQCGRGVCTGGCWTVSRSRRVSHLRWHASSRRHAAPWPPQASRAAGNVQRKATTGPEGHSRRDPRRSARRASPSAPKSGPGQG